jgi:hypothetical protein
MYAKEVMRIILDRLAGYLLRGWSGIKYTELEFPALIEIYRKISDQQLRSRQILSCKDLSKLTSKVGKVARFEDCEELYQLYKKKIPSVDDLKRWGYSEAMYVGYSIGMHSYTPIASYNVETGKLKLMYYMTYYELDNLLMGAYPKLGPESAKETYEDKTTGKLGFLFELSNELTYRVENILEPYRLELLYSLGIDMLRRPLIDEKELKLHFVD